MSEVVAEPLLRWPPAAPRGRRGRRRRPPRRAGGNRRHNRRAAGRSRSAPPPSRPASAGRRSRRPRRPWTAAAARGSRPPRCGDRAAPCRTCPTASPAAATPPDPRRGCSRPLPRTGSDRGGSRSASGTSAAGRTGRRPRRPGPESSPAQRVCASRCSSSAFSFVFGGPRWRPLRQRSRAALGRHWDTSGTADAPVPFSADPVTAQRRPARCCHDNDLTPPPAPPADRLAELHDIVSSYRTCEFATLNRAGLPFAWPAVCEIAPDGTGIVLTTCIGFPRKAINVRRDPRVALLFSDPTGTGRTDLPQVLVQGTAVCPEEIHTSPAGLESYWRQLWERQPSSKGYARHRARPEDVRLLLLPSGDHRDPGGGDRRCTAAAAAAAAGGPRRARLVARSPRSPAGCPDSATRSWRSCRTAGVRAARAAPGAGDRRRLATSACCSRVPTAEGFPRRPTAVPRRC